MRKPVNVLGDLPTNVVPDAIALMDKINGTHFPINSEILTEEIHNILARDYHGAALDEELQRLKIDTPEGMNLTINAYAALREKHPKMRFCKKSETNSGMEVTDTALFIIDSVVKKHQITDRFDIVSAVCDVLERKFGESERLESNLDKFNLRTTKDILHAVDIYFVMQKLYPETVYGRARMEEVWSDVI